MPWVNYEPVNLYKGVPGTTLADLTLRPFNAAAVPSGRKVVINAIVVTNTAASDTTITLAHVDGTNVHYLLAGTTVRANSVLKLDALNVVMEPGDKLQASQGTLGSLNLSISGAVVS